MTENTTSPTRPRPVDAIAERYVAEYAALDPLAATYLGVDGHEDELTDISPDGFAARQQLTRRALADASAAEPVDERERVAKDAFLERLGLEAEMYDAAVPQSQVSVISSGLHDVRQVFDLMATEGEDAWSAIDARLAAIPLTLDGYRQTLLDAARSGNVSARRQLSEVAAQVRGWTGQEGGGRNFFSGLVDQCTDDGSLGAQLRNHAELASRAFESFGRFLESELAPRGREKEAVGRELYTLASRYFLGATIDLEETYAWGWQELKRIEDDMADVAGRIAPGGSVDDAVAALDADPARHVSGKENFRDWMQQLADKTVDEMAGVHFDIPQPIRRRSAVGPASPIASAAGARNATYSANHPEWPKSDCSRAYPKRVMSRFCGRHHSSDMAPK